MRNRSGRVYAGLRKTHSQQTYQSARRHLKAVNAVRFHMLELDATG